MKVIRTGSGPLEGHLSISYYDAGCAIQYGIVTCNYAGIAKGWKSLIELSSFTGNN
jgi:hypothetical protein